MATNVINFPESKTDTYWGYHLMLNAMACDGSSITSKQNIENFVKDLVKRIDMKAYGEPIIVDFGSGNKAGFTMVQLIETSNICAHFCNDTGDVYLDVFSCKPFDNLTVKKCFSEYFKPRQVASKRINRQA